MNATESVNRKFPELTPAVRGMMMYLIDDLPQNASILYILTQQRPKQLNRMLHWLVINQVRGRKLYQWFYLENKGSPLLALTELTRRIEKADEQRSLFGFKDFE